MKKLKILYLCGFPPLPLVAGNRHRIYHIGRILQDFSALTLGIVSQHDLDVTHKEEIKDEFGDFLYMHASEAPDRSMIGKTQRFINKKWVAGRHYSIDIENRTVLEQNISEYDLVWIHTLKVADSIGRYSWPNSILDLDDLNQGKYNLAARVEKKTFSRISGWWRTGLWKKWEKDALNRFSLITVCSEEDRELLDGNSKVHVVPNGIELPREKPIFKMRNQQLLGFIGTLGYHPNLEGLQWFIQEIFPSILERIPNVRLRVVGQLPNKSLSFQHPNIDVLGFLDDYTSEMATWSASLVPLRIGGGTRLKILDAFSKLCPVVSTTLGAYGLGVENGRELLLADTAEEFTDACLTLIDKPDLVHSLIEHGWNLVSSRFSWKQRIHECVGKTLQHYISIQ